VSVEYPVVLLAAGDRFGRLGSFAPGWNNARPYPNRASETQLTRGQKDYGYSTDNAGWRMSDAAILLWSPDSTKIATFQQDQRKTGEMYLVPVSNSHPAMKRGSIRWSETKMSR